MMRSEARQSIAQSADEKLSHSGGHSSTSPQSATATIFLTAIAVAFRLLAKNRISRRPEKLKSKARQFGRQDPLESQLRRALESNRGRRAVSPMAIPSKGWKDIFWRTTSRVSEDRLLAVAAGVSFYGLLALFPAVAAVVSCYGLFAPTHGIDQHLSFLATVMPSEVYSIVQGQVLLIVSKGEAKLSFGFLLGFGVAVWSANAGVKALIDALNVVYQEDEKRTYLRLSLVSLAFTVAGVVAVSFALGVVVVVPLGLLEFGLAEFSETIVKIGSLTALTFGTLLGLSVLYRYGPSRREAKWKWISVGAVFATLALFAGSAALSFYMAKFANYDATYGSLGAAVGTLIWMWMSAVVILLGAELNSEIEHQTAMDSTIGKPKPLGSRGATMADTVGPAQVP